MTNATATGRVTYDGLEIIPSKKPFRPVGDRILVRRLPKIAEIETSAEGTPNLVLPDIAQRDQYEGIVISVGPGRYAESGELIPITIQRGDCAVFPTHAGYAVGPEEDELLVMTADDVLCVR